jgi:hypothetical protein
MEHWLWIVLFSFGGTSPAWAGQQFEPSCVVDPATNNLVTVSVSTDPATNQLLVAGTNQLLLSKYPNTAPPYFALRPMFVNNAPIVFSDRRYVKFGLPRILRISDVGRVGIYLASPVFAAAGSRRPYEVLYLPVQPGCEFQPYQIEIKAGAVRG